MLPCQIFEDDHLLVVNKPAGLNTHAPSPYAGEGLYDWLRHREPRWAKLAIIQRLERTADPDARVLGVTACDLYVPVLTFVFGEAQLEGNCALVSLARLKDEFYGLPPRDDLLHERLLKEAVHELGHTFGLRHCPDWQCVMTSSHAVERLDIKNVDFCASCRKEVAGFYW